MFKRILWQLLFVLPLLLLGHVQASAQEYDERGYAQNDDYGNDIDVSDFYEPLASYGSWHYTPQYGYVWIPEGLRQGWRPYQDGGHWAWTDYGWTWVSDYPWGWAAFHYGRWVLLDNYYWVWVPDTVWGPAWVAWRYNDSYVGWSPLPPGAYYYPSRGIEVSVNIPIGWWTFVPGAYILSPTVYNYSIPRSHADRIYYASSPSYSYGYNNGIPVCHGVEVSVVRRWIGGPLRPVSITVTRTYSGRPVYSSTSISIYRPPARSVPVSRVVPPPAPRSSAPAALSRMPAPPPAPRAGYSASQNYSQRATYQQSVAPAAYRSAPQSNVNRARETAPTYNNGSSYRTAPPPAGARQDREEIQRARDDARDERQDVQQERRELREDMRTQPTNRAEIREDRERVRESRDEAKEARERVREERRETSQERRERSR